ncbi:MAG: MFS transporter [Deinococcus sp.]|nr:MFS transporter [Deinococcus sp.]
MQRSRLLAGSFLGLFMSGVIAASPGAVFPSWQRELHIDHELAYYFNSFLVGVMVSIALANRSRMRHPWYSLALVTAAAALVGISLAPSFAVVVVSALFLGLAVGTINVHSNGLPGDLFPENRILVLFRVNAAFGIGSVCGPLLMTFLPWRTSYLLFAVVAVVAALLVLKAPQVATTPGTRGERRAAGLLPLVFLTVSVYTGLEVGLATFSGQYLGHLGYPERLTGLLLSLYWAGLTLGRLTLGGFFSRRPLRGLSIFLSATVLAVGFFFFPLLAPFFPLAGFLIGPTFPTFVSMAQLRFGPGATGYMLYAGALGGTLAPALLALLPVTTLPLGLLSLSLVLATLTLYLLGRNASATL